MNSDSLLIDSSAKDVGGFVPPSSDDSIVNTPSLPTAKQLGISIETGNVPVLTQGDTFDFPVTVSWSVNGSALLVVPVNSVNTKGITQLGVSQESARAVVNGQEKASITFVYKLVANDTGALSIPSIKFEIPTQLGSSIEMRSESVAVQVNSPMNIMPVLVGVVVGVLVMVAAFLRIYRRKRARVQLAVRSAAEDELRNKMLTLKQRVNAADSRMWLLELESLCKEYALLKFGASQCGLDISDEGEASVQRASEISLEALQKSGLLEGWDSLLEEFAHARYGGGKRDGFENRETWKAAMKLMGIEEE